MPLVFKSMELHDEDKLDMAVPCGPCVETGLPKKLLPEFPWGLRITLDTATLKTLGIEPADLAIDGMLHLHCMAAVTSISCDKRQDGSENHRVELQIQQMAVESEDKENQEAEDQMPKKSRARVLYDKG